MNKKEKINRKKAIKRVKTNINLLNNTSNCLEDIFNISFQYDNFTLFNVMTPGGYKEVTYFEAKNTINKFANYFVKEINNKEKYVGLLLDNNPLWIYCFYGLLSSGFIPVLLSYKNKREENLLVCEKINIKTIITNLEGYENYHIINPFVLILDGISNEPIKKWQNEVVFLSSGTSGECKIVTYTGKELSEQIKAAYSILQNSKEISKSYHGYLKHLLVLPLYHVFGFIACFLWFSFFNVTFIIPLNLSNIAIQQACLLAHPTHIFAVPLFWQIIEKEINKTVDSSNLREKFNKGINFSIKLQKTFPRFGLFIAQKVLFRKYLDSILGKSIKFCISGGSFISEQTLKLINALGYPLVNGYGTTEAGITSLNDSSNIKDRISTSIGYPFSNIKYILSKESEGLSKLVIEAASVSKSILDKDNRIENNQKIITNDIVKFEGRTYSLLGRDDEIIVDENGENYSLVSIENSLNFKNSNDFIVFFSKEKKYFILLASYSKTILSKKISDDYFLNKDKFSSLKIFEFYFSYWPFPKSNEVKIKRNAIIEHFNSKKEDFNYFNEESLESFCKEEIISKEILDKTISLFKDYFDVENVNENSNFYTDLGGDSLGYVTLLTNIKTSFDINIDFKEPFPLTPREFSLYIMRSIK